MLICIRSHPRKGGKPAVNIWLVWDSPEELLEAERVLLDEGCGPGCEHGHVLAWRDEQGCHTRPSIYDPTPPPTLAELYPRGPSGAPPELWETPDEFNEPLHSRGPMITRQRIQRGQTIALLHRRSPQSRKSRPVRPPKRLSPPTVGGWYTRQITSRRFAMTDSDNDWLAEEKRRHGPVTEEEIHQGYDAVLDARAAARRAEEDRLLGGALMPEVYDGSTTTFG